MALEDGVVIRSAFGVLNNAQYHQCGVNFSTVGEKIIFSLTNERSKIQEPELFMKILNETIRAFMEDREDATSNMEELKKFE